MFKIIAIILLAISTAGAGYFGWTQKKSVVAVSAQVEELTQKVEEADKKVEATEEELAASKDMLPPLMTKAQELEAVKAAFSTGTVLKDLEAVYAKEKKGLSPERQLGLAGVRLLTNGTKDPATVEAFQKALEMTDWKAQQKVICAAQNALAAAGQKIKVMSECAPEAEGAKSESKADAHAAPAGKTDAKDAHGAPAGKDDKKGGKKDAPKKPKKAFSFDDYLAMLNKPGVIVDIKETAGLQDLYFVFKNPKAKPLEPIVSLKDIQFNQ